MNLLLDTHVLVWAATDDSRLSAHAIQLIDDDANALFFSAASLWELTIKGAQRTGISPALLRDALMSAGYIELPVTSDHCMAVDALPNHHRDPFDRIMVAQALVEELKLVTHDRLLGTYPHTLSV